MTQLTELQRGFRGKLTDYFNLTEPLTVDISVKEFSEYDSCCFGVDSTNTLSDENYMIFYNQMSSPNHEIQLKGSGSQTQYIVNLSKLPNHICKLVFTISIDGHGIMKQVQTITIQISQNNSLMTLLINGDSFQDEKAIIAVELYKKVQWRIVAIASGFNGGLSALLKHFGGQEEVETNDNTFPPSNKVSLEKKLEQNAPKLVSLAKSLKVSLEKYKLTDTVAQVALVIDISGSMSIRYKNGTVQEIINRTVPLAVQFDDDGELDLWYYGSTSKQMPSVNTKNYQTAVPNDWKGLMKSLGGNNYEPEILQKIISTYKNSKLPAYIVFISDGGVSHKTIIKNLIRESSSLPIFWQFIGVGGHNYGIFEQLDNLSERLVDNANFFALDDFQSISPENLYSRMLAEFPLWLKEAKEKHIL